MSIPISDVEYLYTPNGSLVTDIIKRTDEKSGIDVNYREVTVWYDGHTITSTTDLDGVVYRKIGDKYYKLQFSGPLDARLFGLEKGTDAWAALTKAVDIAAKIFTPVYIPEGRYWLSKALVLPNNIEIIGDGIGKSWIDNGWSDVEGGILLKAAGPFPQHIRLRNLSFNGSQHWFDINSDSPQSYFDFENIEIWNFSKGLTCNHHFLANIFKNVNFLAVDTALELNGGTSNYNAFYSCNFSGKRSMIIRNQSEANVFYSCRSEGGGDGDSTPTIEVENATNLKFIGCYFESTGINILKEITSRNGVTFDDCHFTGAYINGQQWQDFHFQTDGIVNFINPYFGESNGIVDGGKITLTGTLQSNSKKELGAHSTQILQNSVHVSEFIITNKALTSNVNKTEIFKIEIPAEVVVANNFKQISGKIYIDSYVLLEGGYPFRDYYEIDVLFSLQTGYNMVLQKNVRQIFSSLFVADIEIEITNNTVRVFSLMNYTSPITIMDYLYTIKVELNKNTTKGYKSLEIVI